MIDMVKTNTLQQQIKDLYDTNLTQFYFVTAFVEIFNFDKSITQFIIRHVLKYNLNWDSLREAELHGKFVGETMKLIYLNIKKEKWENLKH